MPDPEQSPPVEGPAPRKVGSDAPFLSAIFAVSAVYLLLIVGMLAADLDYAIGSMSLEDARAILADENIQSSIRLTVISCTLSAILSLVVAVPTGYLLSRYRFFGKTLVDAVLDIPIVLPPLVIGLSLLILFNNVTFFGHSLEEIVEASLQGLFEFAARIPLLGEHVPTNLDLGLTYRVPAVILAQFTVACAFAVRTMRNTFDQIGARREQVALTLGCNRSQAFWHVVVPESWRGISTAGTLAWTRAMGEFGPILVFAGAIRGRTEVLSTSVFLEISIGNLEGAVVVSLLMVTIAIIVLIGVRIWDKGNHVRI
ncbi:MAG: ABC transporter permease [Verrucomicrobiales bacterium]